MRKRILITVAVVVVLASFRADRRRYVSGSRCGLRERRRPCSAPASRVCRPPRPLDASRSAATSGELLLTTSPSARSAPTSIRSASIRRDEHGRLDVQGERSVSPVGADAVKLESAPRALGTGPASIRSTFAGLRRASTKSPQAQPFGAKASQAHSQEALLLRGLGPGRQGRRHTGSLSAPAPGKPSRRNGDTSVHAHRSLVRRLEAGAVRSNALP